MESELNLSAHSWCAHPAEDALEEYAFERLSEPEAAELEEHLLVCSSCQTTLQAIDEYILLMKQAAAETERARVRPRRRFRSAAIWGAAAALAMSSGVLVWTRAEPQIPPEPVQLIAFRGGDSAHVHAGRPFELRLDLSGVAQSKQYRVELVNAAGTRIWQIDIGASSGLWLAVPSLKPLRRGIYWVRLYSAGGELLREFGLTADQN